MAAEAAGAPVHAILGGAGGIGSALARRLTARGHRVALAGRTAERLEPLAAELGADWRALDARDAEAVDAWMADVRQRHGRLDGVANCVGSLLLKPAHLTRPDEWADTLAANLTTAFAALRAAVRAMGDGGGSVVLVSSAAARIGLPNHEAIAAAKAGVIGLTLAAAATYAPRGIRVNAVAPGLVETPLTERITGSPPARQASLDMHALRRLGTPDDVAGAIGWLLDADNGWVTGQVIGIDGGLGSLRSR